MNFSSALQVVSTFDCSPMETLLRNAVARAGIADTIRVTPPQQLSQHMLAPPADSEDSVGTIVVVRLEDWLRDHAHAKSGELSDSSARLELRKQLDEFVSQLAVLTLRGRPVWLLTCPSNGWIAERFKLVTLCRTMSNLFAVRVRNLPQVTVLNWPPELSSEEVFDLAADQLSHIPLTVTAYEQLGESIAAQMASRIAASDANVFASAGSAELAAFLGRLLVSVTVSRTSASDRQDVDRILRTAASFSVAGESPTASESDIDHVMNSNHSYVVSVSDRLADYGVTGVIAGRTEDDALVVESMSLSCTVLGKQVEYALLSALGEIAGAQQLGKIVFEFRSMDRNQPTLAFLRQATNEEPGHRFVLQVGEVDARIQQAAIAPSAWSLKLVLPQR